MAGKELDVLDEHGKDLSADTDDFYDDGHTDDPIRSGMIVAQSVLPELNERTLSRLETAKTPQEASTIASKTIAKACRKERKRILDEAHAEARKQSKRRKRRRSDDPKANDLLPRSTGPFVRLHGILSFGGAGLVDVPAHSTSTYRAGVLTPWLASGLTMFEGPLIGRETASGTPFRFDAWSPVRAGVTTSVNGMVVGMMGSGKSMFLKTLAIREISYGRHIIIMSDPKGEWVSVADAVGGQSVQVGHGNYLNPLDVGSRPSDLDDEHWLMDCRSRRSVALSGLVSSLREGVMPTSAEQSLLDAASEDMCAGLMTPTVTALVEALDGEWGRTRDVRGLNPTSRDQCCRSLILTLDKLVHGFLQGAFECESTIGIDPSSPMIVFDTSGIDGNDTVRRSVYTAALSALIDSILTAKDGLYRIIIAEEGWEVLSNPMLVDAWDKRMRMTGDWACSNWMLLHELADLEKFGDANSAQRKKVDGILTLSETKVIYRQSPSSLEYLAQLLPDLTDDEKYAIPRLERGVGLFRVGDKVRTLVHPIVSKTAYPVLNTDSGRFG